MSWNRMPVHLSLLDSRTVNPSTFRATTKKESVARWLMDSWFTAGERFIRELAEDESKLMTSDPIFVDGIVLEVTGLSLYHLASE